eukprot:362942-Chlamydomonas_euryale.AAC.6
MLHHLQTNLPSSKPQGCALCNCRACHAPQVEAARALSNLSRVQVYRGAMADVRVLEAVLLLLDHNSLELLHSLAGTLINFTLDR